MRLHKKFSLNLSLFVLAVILAVFNPGCAFILRKPVYKAGEIQSLKTYRGAFHIHSNFSHDSHATLQTIQNTAKKAKLDFAVITDHNNSLARDVYAGMDEPAGPLLIFGTEISTGDGHLIALGVRETPPSDLMSGQAAIDWVRKKGGQAILAHPICDKNPWDDLSVKGFSGLEVYNFAHSFYRPNKVLLATKILLLPPKTFLRSFYRAPEQSLALWDEKLRTGQYAAFGGTDAHIKAKILGFSPESFMMNLQSVTMLVRSEALKPENITEALVKGRSFIAFEVFGDAQDFSFEASANKKIFSMGDSIKSREPVTLSVKIPEDGDMRLIYQGKVIAGSKGRELSYMVSAAGAYRAEVYKKGKLWILSNPIYLK